MYGNKLGPGWGKLCSGAAKTEGEWMKENLIRRIELGVALAAGYLGVITVVQTTIYAKILIKIEASFLGELLKEYIQYFDLVIIAAVLFTIFNLWRKGDGLSIARLFSLNMFLFFSAVLDYSTFNWVGLIFNFTPEPKVSATWVFTVGLILQITYLLLRYTVRFRSTRDELFNRGATEEDIDQVSRGQMGYLTLLILISMLVTTGIFFSVPLIDRTINQSVQGLPVPHLVIGFIVVMGITSALIIYLRGVVSQQTPKQELGEDSLSQV
jgi:hypothetical protein